MMLDANLSFVAYGSPLSCVGATGATFASDVLDTLGLGVGVTPSQGSVIKGNTTLFGSALGSTQRAQLIAAVGTAFVASTGSPTLIASLQAAADDGTGNPSTWYTICETAALTAAQLIANQVFMRFDLPLPFPENLNPRFFRILFTTATGTNFSAGTIAYANVVLGRDDIFPALQAANNFVTTSS